MSPSSHNATFIRTTDYIEEGGSTVSMIKKEGWFRLNFFRRMGACSSLNNFQLPNLLVVCTSQAAFPIARFIGWSRYHHVPLTYPGEDAVASVGRARLVSVTGRPMRNSSLQRADEFPEFHLPCCAACIQVASNATWPGKQQQQRREKLL